MVIIGNTVFIVRFWHYDLYSKSDILNKVIFVGLKLSEIRRFSVTSDSFKHTPLLLLSSTVISQNTNKQNFEKLFSLKMLTNDHAQMTITSKGKNVGNVSN